MSAPATVDASVFRRAFRCHAQGIAIVTTVDQFGNQWGMTATSVTSVSLDPPLVLACLDNRSGLVGPIVAAAGFNVHLLSGAQEELARTFASPIADKLEAVPHSFSRSGCARLGEALAWLECVGHAAYPGGDHTIVVGRVVEVAINDDAEDALVFFEGRMVAQRRRAG